ncbi:MAG: hypothetical protein IJD13_00035 [Oscillospiraceae bacterium]|nr:hypothetical protein [Oscillospiraceae bacterium]
MNRTYVKFLLKRDLKYYRIAVPAVLVLLIFGQFCSFAGQLHSAYRELLRIVIDDPVLRIGHQEPDPDLTAESLSVLFSESGMMTSAVIVMIFLLALAIPCFLTDTKDGKNIATQMRLPISRLHYAGVRLLLPTAVMTVFLLAELIVCLSCWGIYHLVIPAECLPEGAAAAPWVSELCRTFFPFAEPERLPAAASSVLLFPATVLLILLAARGRDIFCISTGVAAVSGCLLFFIPGILSNIFTPVITVITVLSCSYAICRRKIF